MSSPFQAALEFAYQHRTSHLDVSGPIVSIGDPSELNQEERDQLELHIRSFRPWRKGPFSLFGREIHANWKSDRKWERVLQYLGSLRGAVVADVGCNNGYFMYRMLSLEPAQVVGLDPTSAFRETFEFLQAFHPVETFKFLDAGFDHLARLPGHFDVIFLMGIVYHHPEPIEILRLAHQALKTGGRLVVESVGIPTDGSYCLFPQGRYAGMRGVWFVPSVQCLENWLRRSGFREVQFHGAHEYEDDHRRSSDGDIPGLGEFLKPEEPSVTVEGYPAPLRLHISARR